MAEIQENLDAGSSAQPFRIDQKLHQILYKAEAAPKLEPMPAEVLPEPVYPQKPDPTPMTRKEYKSLMRSAPGRAGALPTSNHAGTAASCGRSFPTCLPNGSAISTATIAGPTTTRSRG